MAIGNAHPAPHSLDVLLCSEPGALSLSSLVSSLECVGVSSSVECEVLPALLANNSQPLEAALQKATVVALCIASPSPFGEDPLQLPPAIGAAISTRVLLVTIQPDSTADANRDDARRILRLFASAQDGQLNPRWAAPPTCDLYGARILTYQSMPIDHYGERLDLLVRESVERILSLCHVDLADEDGGEVYWPEGGRSLFNRLHETTSALTALGNAGIQSTHPLVGIATNGLSRVDAGNVADRAAAVYLLSMRMLPEDQVLSFCRMLSDWRNTDLDLDDYGSVVLPQGDPPSGSQEHWDVSLHPGGAAFHACHLSEALLTVPGTMREGRPAALDALRGFRACLSRQFLRHDGWAVGRTGHKSEQTLYAYAVAPQLGIPLPTNWKTVAEFALAMAAEKSHFSRSLAVMNICYMARVLGTDEAHRLAVEFVRDVAREWIEDFLASPPSVVPDSGFLRALVYASTIEAPGHGRIINASAWRAVRDWIQGSD